MSYCDWNSGEFKSDVYCYKPSGSEYYIVDIRDRTSRIMEKLPPRPTNVGELTWYYWEKEAENAIEEQEINNLRLPYNGKRVLLGHPFSTACFLLKLKNWGYHVPDFAVERLLSESEADNNMKTLNVKNEGDSTETEKVGTTYSTSHTGKITFISLNVNYRRIYGLIGIDKFVEP